MTDLSYELQSCGMSFFVEYFDRFCCIDWHDDIQVSACKLDIKNELSQKKRPDGGQYTYNGLSIRFSSVFAIFAQGMQYDALKLIANSSRTPSTVRSQAQRYLDLAIMDQRKQEELLLEQKRAEQEQCRKEEEKRVAQEQKEKSILQLKEALFKQEHILAGTKKWLFWGKNAKLRKETLQKIDELKCELRNYGELF